MNDLRHYDVIRSPMITEKAISAGEFNKYVFKVDMSASKPEIKAAIEALFKVTVTKVNVVVTKGKTKRFRNVPGRRSDVKKAVVTLADGQTIDTTTGL